MEHLERSCIELEFRFSDVIRKLSKLEMQIEEDFTRLSSMLETGDNNILIVMKVVSRMTELETEVQELEQVLRTVLKKQQEHQDMMTEDVKTLTDLVNQQSKLLK